MGLRKEENKGVDDGRGEMRRHVADGDHGGGITCKQTLILFTIAKLLWSKHTNTESKLAFNDSKDVGADDKGSTDEEHDDDSNERVVGESGVLRVREETSNGGSEGWDPEVGQCNVA